MMADERIGGNAPGTDDTVSLVDLVAVVLRRRRLITVATLGAAVLALVVFLVYPPYKMAVAERERIVEVNMSLMLGSGFRVGIGEAEGTNYLIQSLYDPAGILSALRTAGYDHIEKTLINQGADQDKALYTIRRRFMDNRGLDGSPLNETSRLYSVRLDKGVIILVFKNGDPEKAKAFLNALETGVKRDLLEFVLPYARATIDSYERLLMVQNPNETIEASIAQGYRDYATAKSLVAGEASPLTLLRKPFVLVPEVSIQAIRRDVLKKCIILVFGVFFLSVFAAFVLQYIDTVKKDPESMGKIQDALKKS